MVFNSIINKGTKIDDMSQFLMDYVIENGNRIEIPYQHIGTTIYNIEIEATILNGDFQVILFKMVPDTPYSDFLIAKINAIGPFNIDIPDLSIYTEFGDPLNFLIEAPIISDVYIYGYENVNFIVNRV